MQRTWQTGEVIRCLISDADLNEVQGLIEEAGEEAAEALQEWIRTGDAPKSLYDAVMRFTRSPDHAFDSVDWEEVVKRIKQHV